VPKGGTVPRVQQERDKVSMQRRLEYASLAAGDVVARLLSLGVHVG
jgi:hypothetical protein